MLKIKNLIKKYGEKTILNIEELYIERGISHLKGINGSGKTTFSKIVSGIIPFEGELTLFDNYNPVKTKIEYRKQVNYAESEPNYPEFLTANDLIGFVGKAKGANKDEMKTIAETFCVNEYANDHVGTYSSGMVKRLSLCLAFLGNPSLILLDEPFNTLDNDAIEIVQNKIQKLHETGVNFILVSHQDIGRLGMSIHSSYLVENHTIKAE
jgi:ABC-2 type transport system ATP-binding protein